MAWIKANGAAAENNALRLQGIFVKEQIGLSSTTLLSIRSRENCGGMNLTTHAEVVYQGPHGVPIGD